MKTFFVYLMIVFQLESARTFQVLVLFSNLTTSLYDAVGPIRVVILIAFTQKTEIKLFFKQCLYSLEWQIKQE